MIKKLFNRVSTKFKIKPPSTLAQRVEKTHAFFDPQNLANLLIEYKGETGLDIGLVVIDVQEQFCDPANETTWGDDKTDSTAERIKTLAPEFRKAGIPVYAVYFDEPKEKAADIDFYKFIPEPEDRLVAKNHRSAFTAGNLREVLDTDNKQLLLVCGVYLDRCVRETVEDGVRLGYDVILLPDLTCDWKGDAGYTSYTLADLKKKGIAILPAAHVLEALKISKTNSAQLARRMRFRHG